LEAEKVLGVGGSALAYYLFGVGIAGHDGHAGVAAAWDVGEGDEEGVLVGEGD